MYGPNYIGTGLTLSKVIGGISKTLGLVNQAIPIYKEVKPIFQNTHKIMGIVREFTSSANDDKQVSKNANKETINSTIKKTSKNENYSYPVFFK